MSSFPQSYKRPQAPKREDFFYSVGTNRTPRITGWFPSLTTGTSHPFHSSTEESWLNLLDLLPGVKTFSTQQTRFHYVDDGKGRRYTPDTRVELFDGTVIYVEVKPEWIAISEEFHRFLAVVTGPFARAGASLQVITDALVHHPVIDGNVRRLHGHRPVIPDERVAFQLTEHLEKVGGETLGRLSQRYRNHVAARQMICSLILRKRLCMHVGLGPLGSDTVVFLPDHTLNPFAGYLQMTSPEDPCPIDWTRYGFPVRLLVDNGSEFRTPRITGYQLAAEPDTPPFN